MDLEKVRNAMIEDILEISGKYSHNDLENRGLMFLKSIYREEEAKKILIDEILNIQEDTLRISENSPEIVELYLRSNLEKMNFSSLEGLLKEIVTEHQMKYREVGEKN